MKVDGMRVGRVGEREGEAKKREVLKSTNNCVGHNLQITFMLHP